MRKLITIILLLWAGIAQAQTYQLNYDSIRVGKTAGTGSTSMYGKVYLKNVSLGLTSDSILVVRNGRIFKVLKTNGTVTSVAKGFGLIADGTITTTGTVAVDSAVMRTVANSRTLAQTQTALNLKANLASPTFTGIPAAPTATAGTNTTQLASTAFVTTAVGSGSQWTRVGTTLSPTVSTDNVKLAVTNSSTTGVIFKGVDRFIHDFTLAGTDGNNTFVGIKAGNFTMTGSTATQGSGNSAFGYSALESNTTGHSNVAIGMSALVSNSTGNLNVALGRGSLGLNTTGFSNVGVGYFSLLDITTGSSNTGVGYQTGVGITTGSGNTIIGSFVTGLTATLTNNIILANGTGAIKAQNNGTDWTLTGAVAATGSISSTPQGTLYGTATGSITSAQLATSLTNETGTGSAVFSTSPTLVTPVLGNATGGTLGLSGALTGTSATFSSAVGLTINNGAGVSKSAYQLYTGTTAASATQNWYAGINVFATNGSYEIKDGGGTVGLTIAPSGAISLSGALTGTSATFTTGVNMATASGYVGIGTASPAAILHLKSTTNLVSIIDRPADTNFGVLSYFTAGAERWVVGLRTTAAAGADAFSIYSIGLGANAMTILANGNVGIGTTSPATSGLLDLTSTTGALILTRMTTTQRNAMTAVNGMLIYNTTTATIQGYQGGAWTNL